MALPPPPVQEPMGTQRWIDWFIKIDNILAVVEDYDNLLEFSLTNPVQEGQVLHYDGSAWTNTDELYMGEGTKTLPVYSFYNGTNTGLYATESAGTVQTIKVSVKGTDYVEFWDGGLAIDGGGSVSGGAYALLVEQQDNDALVAAFSARALGGSSAGPVTRYLNYRASPGATDTLGEIQFWQNDTASTTRESGALTWKARQYSPTASGTLEVNVREAGSRVREMAVGDGVAIGPNASETLGSGILDVENEVHSPEFHVDDGTNIARILVGTGTPESAVTGSVGDIFLRTNGGASTTLYVKESGTSTNTGWVAK